MHIFVMIMQYDGGLLKQFLSLCKDFRKHLLFELQQQSVLALDRFRETYKDYFELQHTYLWQSEITFGQVTGTRVDKVLRFKVLKPCMGKTVQFSSISERTVSLQKSLKQQTKFQFDCYWQG